MTKSLKITLLTILFTLVVFSSPAYAHFYIPIPNYFSKDSIVYPLIWTILLILIQSLLLKWLIREIPYSGSLWRSALINIVLSAAVSLLLPYRNLDPISLLLYFILCAIPTVPLLYLLYRRIKISWISSFRIGLVVNLISYVGFLLFLFAAGATQWGAEVLLDRYQVSKWNDSQILRPASGRIYATYFPKSGKHDYRFSCFDTKTLGWKEMGHIPEVDGFYWDVEGEILAYVVGYYGYSKDNHKFLRIYSLAESRQSYEISPSELLDPKPGTDPEFHYVKISPDGKKLAVILRGNQIQGYRDGGGFSILGGKCKLFIIDTHTGKIIAAVPRWASDHEAPCWLPDSGSVLFRSYRDEKLYEGDLSDTERGKVYNFDDRKDPRFASGLYKFDLADGSVTWFGEGEYPRLDIVNNSIIMPVEEGVRILDIATGRETVTQIQGLAARGPVIPSPTGKLLVCFMKGHAKEMCPVVLDLRDPNKKFAIDNDMAESWTGKLSWSSKELP